MNFLSWMKLSTAPPRERPSLPSLAKRADCYFRADRAYSRGSLTLANLGLMFYHLNEGKGTLW